MAIPKFAVPQNSPLFVTAPNGEMRMARPWVLFFQQLQKLSTEVLTTITSGLVDNFASIDTGGQIKDSGYDATSFVLAIDPGVEDNIPSIDAGGQLKDSGYDATSFVLVDDLPDNDVTTDVLTALTGGTPNLQKKSRSFHVVDGITQAIGAESAATDVKPKAYIDIDLGLQASPSGASAPGLENWNSTGIYVYAFDGAATSEQLFSNCEYNHQFKEGADIYPHVHWAPTTTAAGNVKWNLSVVWDNPGTAPSTVVTTSVTQAAPGVAFQSQVANFPTVSGTSKTIGSQIQFRLWRNPADAADTYGADAVIQTLGFHAEVDSFGSTQVAVK